MHDKTGDDGKPIADEESVNEAIGAGALGGAAVAGQVGGSALGDIAGAPPAVVGANDGALDQNEEAEEAAASRR